VTGAGGDELEFAGTVNAVVDGHSAGEYPLDGAGPEENVFGIADTKRRVSAPSSLSRFDSSFTLRLDSADTPHKGGAEVNRRDALLCWSYRHFVA
jgi:hypothetical protein